MRKEGTGKLKAACVITLAIRKLFEIRIFGCAVGDFTAGSRPLIFHRNVRNINVETKVMCECMGLEIPGVYQLLTSFK